LRTISHIVIAAAIEALRDSALPPIGIVIFLQTEKIFQKENRVKKIL
jgi:hypothetical protein